MTFRGICDTNESIFAGHTIEYDRQPLLYTIIDVKCLNFAEEGINPNLAVTKSTKRMFDVKGGSDELFGN